MGASSSTTRRRSTSGIQSPRYCVPFAAKLTSKRRTYARIACKPVARQDASMSDIPLLVDPRWVQRHPEARLADLRWAAKGPPARERYDAGHLPGAVFVDLDHDLS